jgi:hypothetical protein
VYLQTDIVDCLFAFGCTLLPIVARSHALSLEATRYHKYSLFAFFSRVTFDDASSHIAILSHGWWRFVTYSHASLTFFIPC